MCAAETKWPFIKLRLADKIGDAGEHCNVYWGKLAALESSVYRQKWIRLSEATEEQHNTRRNR
jgi:hypothetical protein